MLVCLRHLKTRISRFLSEPEFRSDLPLSLVGLIGITIICAKFQPNRFSIRRVPAYGEGRGGVEFLPV